MKNHMKEVAEMLGVELGEEFEVRCDNSDDPYITAKITDKGLEIVGAKTVYAYSFLFGNYTRDNVLSSLLQGTCELIHKPWRPKYKDQYYSVGPGGVLEPGVWMGDFIDKAMYKLGNCYRSPEEATAHSKKWIKFYESEKHIKI